MCSSEGTVLGGGQITLGRGEENLWAELGVVEAQLGTSEPFVRMK